MDKNLQFFGQKSFLCQKSVYLFGWKYEIRQKSKFCHKSKFVTKIDYLRTILYILPQFIFLYTISIFRRNFVKHSKTMKKLQLQKLPYFEITLEIKQKISKISVEKYIKKNIWIDQIFSVVLIKTAEKTIIIKKIDKLLLLLLLQSFILFFEQKQYFIRFGRGRTSKKITKKYKTKSTFTISRFWSHKKVIDDHGQKWKKTKVEICQIWVKICAKLKKIKILVNQI